MKRVFVSDFDGTITKRDFFLIYMDRYLGEKGKEFLRAYRAENNPSYQFLNWVFAMKDLTRDEYLGLIRQVQIDADFRHFLEVLQSEGMEHIILSAGVYFYIEDALAINGFPKQKVIANTGQFADGRMLVTHDESDPFFCPMYGIAKGKVIEHLKQQYDYVYFAGNSIPDLLAAEVADEVFATGTLKKHFEKEGIGQHKVHPFTGYADILHILRRDGAIKS